jgi:hypothetical protein
MGYYSIKDNVTCIIPFYNEDKLNLRKTIRLVSGIKQIENIILVDDGSKSKETFDFLKNTFSAKKNIKILRLAKNHGKSFAIKFGLSVSFSDNIILLDADLINLDRYEISSALNKFKLFDLDMLILSRVNSLPLVKLIRANTLLSGERIIKKNHLKKILNSDVEGYQLETATNQYFINNNLQNTCYWSPSSAVNNYKFRKINFFKGIFKDFKMYVNLISYIGLGNCIKQFSSFCKENV